jgi:predicted  nucleic acid-binding Zn-ribbon protein
MKEWVSACAQGELKVREVRQQQEKLQSRNALRKKDEDRRKIQTDLDAASTRAAAADAKVQALEQTIERLQNELKDVKARSAGLQKDLAICRTQLATKVTEQVSS